MPENFLSKLKKQFVACFFFCVNTVLIIFTSMTKVTTKVTTMKADNEEALITLGTRKQKSRP